MSKEEARNSEFLVSASHQIFEERGGPAEVNETLEAKSREAGIIRLDVMNGLPFSMFDVADFAHLNVLAHGEDILCRMEVLLPRAIRAGAVTQAEFCAKLSPGQK